MGLTSTGAARADCERRELARLQGEMHRACDKRGTSCRYPQSIKTLQRNQASHEECVARRQEIQDRCFTGRTDRGHALQIESKKRAAAKCQRLIRLKRMQQSQTAPTIERGPF
jgi:hypothetical protein